MVECAPLAAYRPPPLSSGPGRGPLKAETRVRTSLGAQKSDKTSQKSSNIEEFLAGLRFEQRGRLEELPFKFC
jgi:hypothetical protein